MRPRRRTARTPPPSPSGSSRRSAPATAPSPAGCSRADTRKALEDEEQKPCREAIGGVEIDAGPPIAVELYLTNAEADLDNGERAFLSQTADGWRLSAAGCKAGDGPPEDVPMDCELEA